MWLYLLALSLAPLHEARGSASASDADVYRVRWWSRADGLPQSSINDIVQTPDGYLWLGTFGGLARFDGVRFRIFDVATLPGLRSNRILSLWSADDGTLWIGTEDAGIQRLGPERARAERVADGSLGAVWDLVGGPDEEIWFASGAGLGTVRDERAELVRDSTGAPYRADRLLVDPERGVWVGGPDAVRLFGDGPVRVAPFEGEEVEFVWDLEKDEDGRLWIGTVRGLFVLQPGTSTAVLRAEGESLSVHACSSGRLWVGTHHEGLLRAPSVDGDLRLEEMDLVGRGGVPRRPKTMFVDREDSHWIGTRGYGLAQLRPSPVRAHEIADEHGEPEELALAPDGLWFLSIGRTLVHRMADGELEHALDESGAPFHDPSLFLHVGPTGRVWLARGDGLWEHRDGRVRPDTLGVAVTSVLEQDDGALWIATPDGLQVRRGGDWEQPAALRGLGGVLGITATVDRLWMHGTHFVARYDGIRLRRWDSDEPGLSLATIRALEPDGSDAVWVGTYGGGLSHLSDDRIVRLTTDSGLRENFVSGIAVDGPYLWTYGNAGISRHRLDELRGVVAGELPRAVPRLYDANDGVAEGQGSRGMVLAADGDLWVSTIHGLVSLDPSLEESPEAVTAIIEEILFDGRVVAESPDRIEIPASGPALEIRYTAPTYLHPETISFQYRLDGFDDHWHDVDRRAAFYTNLPPGSYRFAVRALGRGPRPGAVATIDVEVIPRLHQTAEFRWTVVLLSLVAVGAALWLGWIWMQRRRERESAEAIRRAQAQRLESLGTLAGGIAHDFNNLLAAISGHAQIAQGAVGGSSESSESLDGVLQASRRAAELVRRILLFARPAASPRTPVVLTDLLGESVALLRASLPATVELRTDWRGPDLRVLGDATALQQVLVNLVTNASQAMGLGGGRVDIRLERSSLGPDEAIELDLEPGPHAVLTVQDDGCGMDEETCRRVFEPFFTTKSDRGTGMGLSVVHGLVRNHRGAIAVDSELGIGTTFRVFLPETDLRVQPQSSEPRRIEGGSERLLVVDDEPELAVLLQYMLEPLGYTVDVCTDPLSALDRLAHPDHRFDLLLTDLDMPKMDGLELASRATASDPTLPILLLTGHGLTVDGERARRCGVRRVLSKPISIDELALAVRDTLGAPPLAVGASEG